MLFKKILPNGRLIDCLSKQYRDVYGNVQTLSQLIEKRHGNGEITHKQETDGSIDWNRRKFNRMNYRAQAEYEKRISSKRYYWLVDQYGNGMQVPKTVYDAIDLPIRDKA